MLLLNPVIAGCTQLNLSQRYESVSWVINDLADLLPLRFLPPGLALGKKVFFQRTMSSVREKIVLENQALIGRKFDATLQGTRT